MAVLGHGQVKGTYWLCFDLNRALDKLKLLTNMLLRLKPRSSMEQHAPQLHNLSATAIQVTHHGNMLDEAMTRAIRASQM